MNKRIRLIFASVLSFLFLFTTVSASVLAATYPITATFLADYKGERTVRYEQRQDRPSGPVYVYTYYSGGSRSWRNHNPGNLKYGTFASTNGAVAKDDGNFAIFPDYDTGFAAFKTKVTVDYKGKTITEFLNIWAPPSENDTPAYIKYVVQQIGGNVTASTKISSLTSTQQTKMLDAMKTYEGFISGSISTLTIPLN